MNIKIDSLIEGAKKADGTVVIVDVFRAFTTAAVVLSRGAHEIIMVAETDTALKLREAGRGDFCMGEIGGKRPPDFDFGNSPFELSRADVKGKILIQCTQAGTAGISSAQKSRVMYAASLVIACSTAKAILQDAPALVTIVAMGRNGLIRTDEDELCALYLRNLLEGRQPDQEAVRKLISASAEAAKYSDPRLPHFHPQDLEIALQIDSLDFAIRVTKENDLFIAKLD